MASSHGDGGMGSNDATGDRVHTRSRKREKAWCFLCLKSGRKSRLQLFQIGPNEAMYLCSEETCPYPVSMTDDIHGSVVTRELSELKISSPQRGSSEKSKSLKSFPTSMPIVIPVESQRIPAIPKEDMSHLTLKRTSSLAAEPLEEQLLQFRLWMREKKRHHRNNPFAFEENAGSGRNGEVREKGDGFATKRPKVRSRNPEFVSDSEGRVKFNSHSNKPPGHKARLTSTPSIRKIDKTLMQASGVDYNKKFEPFTITPQEKLSKKSPSRSPDPESSSENRDADANNLKPINSEDPYPNTQTDAQECIVQNNENAIDPSNDATLTTHKDSDQPINTALQPLADVLPLDPLQMPMGQQDQWQQPPQQGSSLPPPNGDLSHGLYSTNLIPPPQYMNSYHMMPPQAHYNTLIPPPASYHSMQPSLESPLSPLPQAGPDGYAQFYYPGPMYQQYSEQWEDSQAELELTKMLDSLDIPPSDQYDPTLGILHPGSPTGADMYDLMDPSLPSAMPGAYERLHPVMQSGINSLSSPPPLNSSIPINASTPDMPSSQVVTQTGGIIQEKRLTDTDEFHELPIAITNGRSTETNALNGVGTFNNTEESPVSSYHSPQSEGEYQSVSLVGSAS